MSNSEQTIETDEDLIEKQKILTELGNAIREQRERRDISQQELSIQSGVDRNTISNLENGKSDIRFYTLFKLLAPLHIPTDILFYPDSSNERHAVQELMIEISNMSDQEINLITRMVVLQKKAKEQK